MADQIAQAVQILKQGGIVIYPTDTVYGIGCRIDNEAAVKRLFAVRNRPQTQPTPVLVTGLEMAKEYLKPIPQDVTDILIKPYWPGGLTVVLDCQVARVPELVRGGGKTIGVRMPNHQLTLTMIGGVGVPILGPSANFHGEPTPLRSMDIDRGLIKLVDFVLKGECGLKQASTVIDASIKPWKILRQGAVRVGN